jgi:isoleucyl-tRNA synthetase/bisphosphoglycerate-dependent phosphoglycerate mutase
MSFEPIDPKLPLASIEPDIQAYWKNEDIFKRSIAQRKKTHGEKKEYTFYDGPPFATGLPHYGHILAGTIKDVIGRYQTMKGMIVERRFGWDCHGLPIENIIEKEQNITDHKQITENLGVEKFCELCRSAVQRYTEDWRKTVERMGRFVDMDHDYRTMDPEFMESIWWAFSELYKKEYIYKGYKPMHICPRCVTTLSNFEVTQGYADRTDMSVVMTFPLEEDPNTVLLAWTTTPWSLPGNLWLLVSPTIEYSQVKLNDSPTVYICAKKLIEPLFKGKEYTVLDDINADQLVGKRYVPLFSYFIDTIIPSSVKSGSAFTYGQKCFTILLDDHDEVTDTEGTGIVHLTNSHGEDGYRIAKQLGVDVLHHVNIDGTFKPEIEFLQGVKVKPEGADPMSTDKLVLQELKRLGRYFSSYTYDHSYPHCWRCDTPLLNYATSSWFVAIENIKEQMLQNKQQTTWVPSHLRDGRYGNWLENARDWAISRNRFWGTPLPIWQAPDGTLETIGSRDELMSKEKLRFTKVTILRHGESEGNVANILQGTAPGTNLTQAGHSQAEATAQFLAKGTVDVIYCSPFARTLQTAEHIAAATGAEIIVDERLIERQFGPYEGQDHNLGEKRIEIARQKGLGFNHPELLDYIEGIEPHHSVAERFAEFMRTTLEKHRSEHVVIVTHGSLVGSAPLFFTTEKASKIANYPDPTYAQPHTYFWDHKLGAQMDLHKHRIDDITWQVAEADESECCTITLVRHGETESNINERVAGHTECELTSTGKLQAAATAKILQDQHFDVLLHSDLHRATHTAELLNETLQIAEVHAMSELRERSFGNFEGKHYKDVLQHAHDLSPFFDVPDETVETANQLYERVQNALHTIHERYKGKRVLVVSHAVFIATALAYAKNGVRKDARVDLIQNAEANTIVLKPRLKRIPEVLDCWFESGSMPYAYAHYPFNVGDKELPNGFPGDFIAEGIDQCRAWFYTLMALSTALFGKTPFKNVVVNGIVLAEDGKKMSKKLKNYPEPMEIVEKYGADSIRFTLMNSPAVRGEDLRMSEQLVEQTLRSVLLPLWNTYSFFVTYALAANFTFDTNRNNSTHPLDVYILAETQDIVNRMSKELDHYDLSACCNELFETIDALTNWYIRLSRRRFSGKSGDTHLQDALHTLYSVLVTFSKVLAPFCPFITEHIYRNLTNDIHGSVHLCDWPEVQELTREQKTLLQKMRTMRQIVALGFSLRGEATIKNRQPLTKAIVAIPRSIVPIADFSPEDIEILTQELNVKTIEFASNPELLAVPIAQVNARKAGPRFGKRVQEIITAGKLGNFTQNEDGTVCILGETLTSDEVQIVYIGKEGSNIAADRGIVVELDTTITPELESEGLARDIIRTIQRLRKEAGFSFTDVLTLQITGFDDVTMHHAELIARETNTVLGITEKNLQNIDVTERQGTIAFEMHYG